MAKSIQEEILFVLHSIAAMTAYSLSFNFFAISFTFLAGCALFGTIYHSVKELKENG